MFVNIIKNVDQHSSLFTCHKRRPVCATQVLPQPEWHKKPVSTEGLAMDRPIRVHYRDALVCAAAVLRHPRCDRRMLAWGPEVEPHEGRFQPPGEKPGVLALRQRPSTGRTRAGSAGI